MFNRFFFAICLSSSPLLLAEENYNLANKITYLLNCAKESSQKEIIFPKTRSQLSVWIDNECPSESKVQAKAYDQKDRVLQIMCKLSSVSLRNKTDNTVTFIPLDDLDQGNPFSIDSYIEKIEQYQLTITRCCYSETNPSVCLNTRENHLDMIR